MVGAPGSPGEDGEHENESCGDNGERSGADRAFTILTIPHAVLREGIGGERCCPGDGSRWRSPPISASGVAMTRLWAMTPHKADPCCRGCTYCNHAGGSPPPLPRFRPLSSHLLASHPPRVPPP